MADATVNDQSPLNISAFISVVAYDALIIARRRARLFG
jgi:hypothetical protein